MFDNRRLVEERIDHFATRLGRDTYRVLAPLEVTAWRAPGEPVPFDEARAHEYAPISPGERWGPAWSTWWFRVRGTVPESARGERVELRMDLGFVGDWAGNQSEGLVFTAEGTPLKGLNPMNRTVPLTGAHPVLMADGVVDLYVEAGANPNMGEYMNAPTTLGDLDTRPDAPVWTFGGAELVIRNEATWQLWLDVDVLRGVMRELPAESTLRATLLRGMEEAMDVYDSAGLTKEKTDTAQTGAEKTTSATVNRAERAASAARDILAPLIASGAGRSAQQMSAVGHAHIDSAWLWPLRETRRKVARTFSNALALADEYPEFTFACTSAQHYAWLKDGYPELFTRVKDAIARGQWHVVGGMWVESDTNLPGGEALVRQFTSGLRWMERELGVRPECLWLPDSFGYTGALPQIAVLAGMRTFFTQKMSWNQTNTLPHHTLWWEGIDGTRIFTHFPPVDCYDSIVSPEEVFKAERNFKEKGRATSSLLPYGYGDGGGGPVREMVERVRRFKAMEGAPVLRFESPNEFFARAREEYPDPPVWTGEMYLEFHRGVYTSQADLKRGNREVEALLWCVEWLGAAGAFDSTGGYPAKQVEQLWQRMLLLQFHDILPGSSIAWVNREAREEYEQLRTELEHLVERALTSPGEGEADGVGGAVPPVILNAASHTRRDIVQVDGTLHLVEVPGVSATPLAQAESAPAHPVTLTRDGTSYVLDNGLIRAVIDERGLLTSVRDLRAQARDGEGLGRELLVDAQAANLLTVHPDEPSCFDAWELQEHYRRSALVLEEAEEIRVVCEDPLRVCLEVDRSVGSSRLTQVITLDAELTALDFEVRIDWRERHRVLRVGFPLALDVHVDRSEIQFGHVTRQIAPNTSWDEARFEISGHRWSLLTEPGYAVAFANSQTYGHSVEVLGEQGRERRSGVRFGYTLLRSPTAPDPTSDQGQHTLRYSLVAGANVRVAHEAGLRLAHPLRLVPGGQYRPPMLEWEEREGDTFAVIDAIKPAFDGSGDVIVRLHEADGRRGIAHLRLGQELASKVSGVSIVDLLEEPLAPDCAPRAALEPSAGVIEIALGPFQIATLRLSRH